MARGEAVAFTDGVLEQGSMARSWTKRLLVADGANPANYKITD